MAMLLMAGSPGLCAVLSVDAFCRQFVGE